VEPIWKSWKTSCLGLAALALTALLMMGRISLDSYMAALGIVAGGGFIFAKDAGVTGK
jgi:hypothetical protein